MLHLQLGTGLDKGPQTLRTQLPPYDQSLGWIHARTLRTQYGNDDLGIVCHHIWSPSLHCVHPTHRSQAERTCTVKM